jgi:hypothetical protein
MDGWLLFFPPSDAGRVRKQRLNLTEKEMINVYLYLKVYPLRLCFVQIVSG